MFEVRPGFGVDTRDRLRDGEPALSAASTYSTNALRRARRAPVARWTPWSSSLAVTTLIARSSSPTSASSCAASASRSHSISRSLSIRTARGSPACPASCRICRKSSANSSSTGGADASSSRKRGSRQQPRLRRRDHGDRNAAARHLDLLAGRDSAEDVREAACGLRGGDPRHVERISDKSDLTVMASGVAVCRYPSKPEDNLITGRPSVSLIWLGAAARLEGAYEGKRAGTRCDRRARASFGDRASGSPGRSRSAGSHRELAQCLRRAHRSCGSSAHGARARPPKQQIRGISDRREGVRGDQDGGV